MNSNLTTSSLTTLDQKLDKLIRHSQDLKRKNAALEAIQNSLMDERMDPSSTITEKNDTTQTQTQTQTQIEIMMNAPRRRDVEEIELSP